MPRSKKITVTDNSQEQDLAAAKAEIATTIQEEIVFPADHDILNASPLKKKNTAKKNSKSNPEPIPFPDPIVELPKVRKPKFKEIHIKDNYWVENDIYQTIADMTKGNKGAKALIINQALKDYLKKNKIEIISFVDKDKHKKN